MDAIFHEQQEGSLCAQHCLNSLLQGQFYSAVDLGELAQELDSLEVSHMAAEGDSEEYRRFLQQPSVNMDDSGFFSVQVITRALSVWGLEFIPYSSSDSLAVRARESPLAANAYICNYREHWFTIRRLGSQWFNLNSLLEYPELVSNTYLGEFLAQLRQEGYSIFIVKGNLPECDADLILQAVPAVQHTRPRLLADVQSSGSQSRSTTRTEGNPVSSPSAGATTSASRDEEADLEAAMMLSLAENVPGSEGGPASIDDSELQRALGRGDEEAEMEMALALSQAEAQQHRAVPQESEEDELQKAISMSLAGSGPTQKLAPAQQPPASNPSLPGWGQRLATQEAEEEELYLAEQTKQTNQEEEELMKALAMSMEQDNKDDAPSKSIVAHTAGKAVTGPAGSSKAGSSQAGSSKASSSQAGSSKTGSILAGSSKADSVRSGPSTAQETRTKTATSPTKASGSGKPPGASPTKTSPLPAAPPAKPLPPSPSRPSLAATLASPETGPVQATMPAVGGHTLGGARRPPTGDTDPAEIRRRRLAFLEKMQNK